MTTSANNTFRVWELCLQTNWRVKCCIRVIKNNWNDKNFDRDLPDFARSPTLSLSHWFFLLVDSNGCAQRPLSDNRRASLIKQSFSYIFNLKCLISLQKLYEIIHLNQIKYFNVLLTWNSIILRFLEHFGMLTKIIKSSMTVDKMLLLIKINTKLHFWWLQTVDFVCKIQWNAKYVLHFYPYGNVVELALNLVGRCVLFSKRGNVFCEIIFAGLFFVDTFFSKKQGTK